jgi:hypothetical protein
MGASHLEIAELVELNSGRVKRRIIEGSVLKEIYIITTTEYMDLTGQTAREKDTHTRKLKEVTK